jgi:hypothetical protein
MTLMTEHALRRAAQRNLSPSDITYIMQHGSRYHRAGACFYHLGAKDIPHDDQREDELTRLEGAVVVLDADQEWVLTVYRNRDDGLKEIRKKRPYVGVAV